MHPSRQAYVEEVEPEVSLPLDPQSQVLELYSYSPRGVALASGDPAADKSFRISALTWQMSVSNHNSMTLFSLANTYSSPAALDRDYDLPSAGAGLAPERASAFQEQMDRRRREAQIVVPTDDDKVRARLREIGQPITLFGEDKALRRDRLRKLLAIEAEINAAEDEDVDEEMRDAGDEQNK